jgi:hypothetical protein
MKHIYEKYDHDPITALEAYGVIGARQDWVLVYLLDEIETLKKEIESLKKNKKKRGNNE